MDNSKEFHDAFIKMINFAKEHLSGEDFNELIYDIYTCGIENVYIEEIPVYENVEWNGTVLWKRIKDMKYSVKIKPDALLKEYDNKKCDVKECDVKDSLDWLKEHQQRIWNAWNS